MSRLVSFVVLIGILVIIVVLFYQVMAVFLLPVFAAALLGVVFQPLYRWSMEKCRGRRYAASGLTTLLVLLAVLAPTALVITMATLQGVSLVEQLQVANVKESLTKVRRQFDLEVPHGEDLHFLEASLKQWRSLQLKGETPELNPDQVQNLLERLQRLEDDAKAARAEGANVPIASSTALRGALEQIKSSKPYSVERDDAVIAADREFRSFRRVYLGGSYRAWLKDWSNPTDQQLEEIRKATLQSAGSPLLSIGGGALAIVGKLLFGMIITLACLFFFFAEGSKMLDAAIRLSPLEEKYVRELVAEFESVCRAVVTATLLSAVVQGLLAGIGFYFAGLTSSVALLMLLTMLFAMVPVTGAATVWVPVCLYLYFIADNTWGAILLGVYSAGVVSTADNFIKPWVLHGQSKLHPLLALLSVLGGIQALGPAGIVVGPMVVVFLQTTLKILQRELLSMDRGSSLGTLLGFRPRAGEAEPAGKTSPPGAKEHSSEESSEAPSGSATASGSKSSSPSSPPPAKPSKKKNGKR